MLSLFILGFLKIKWDILLVGIEIQFVLGVLLLRTEFGYKLFEFVSAEVTKFLRYTDQGSMLVFGETYTDHSFAFQILPVIKRNPLLFVI